MRGDDHNIYRAVLQIISKYTNLKIARQLALLLGEQYQNKKQQTNKQTETTTKSKNTKKKTKKTKTRSQVRIRENHQDFRGIKQ